MRLWRAVLMITLALASLVLGVTSASATESKKVSSGKTQVVAKLDGREITISDLRSEMLRLGLTPNSPDAERVALENIVNRRLLASAARKANFHRQPEALRRMAAAEEQALADLYAATASQPPEPTRAEIEDYILANPTLFSERRLYTFSVLTLPTDAFDQKKLTPVFDNSKDFSALVEILTKSNVTFAETPLRQLSSAFPEPIRKQLAQYGPRDNIVIKGDLETQIFKIVDVTNAFVPSADAPALARQLLLQQSSRDRTERLLASLKKEASVSYYRASAAPAPHEKRKK